MLRKISSPPVLAFLMLVLTIFGMGITMWQVVDHGCVDTIIMLLDVFLAFVWGLALSENRG